jgi:hypothetical protein
MRAFACGLLAAVTAIGITALAPKAQAQIGIEAGAAPDCHGYYDVPPYSCAPPGYYGPEWFANGVFIGAGPWFRGSDDFRGYVDNHYHPDRGYKGRLPERGERADPAKRVDSAHFKGNELRDGRGHTVNGSGHGGRNEKR